jgi:hypothetical protein
MVNVYGAYKILKSPSLDLIVNLMKDKHHFDPKGPQAAVAATLPKLHIGMHACFNTDTESQAWQLPKVQR